LGRIDKFQKIKMFEVDCREPIKELSVRIEEIEYLIEQKYLNNLFNEIHDIEKKMIYIKNSIHNKEIKISNLD
jgi:hypothetical protein